ncbi:TauD/TfdA family dioxygenase [Streptomyces sp. NBC_00338]|uniref:TauD/TfdA family dioxygenase n=1 Tax=Streptomyces sp. NBC_00338 TaxID=2975715 RepID=UPI0022584BDA|nr:TauD/TfdA family dioxygenase [Streptomyces sp. NBC_00338]MCX5143567.1 TauD/TfdA family dioxygenase [Streptomyces sp. NBC_00338]
MLRVPDGDDTAGWVSRNRDGLRSALEEHGAVLVRGLGLRDASGVEAVLRQLAVEPVREREAFAARETYAPGVHSPSAWPSNQPMCMHHELSYTLGFPGLMLFACLAEPTSGGAVCLADAAAVLDSLPRGPAERFERTGWLLTRSYNGEIGVTVADAFGTDDRYAVEEYCRDHAIDWAWQPDGALRTTQHRSAVVRHPAGGRRCWFNQIAFLNEWTLDPEVRAYLVDEYGAGGLPFNTRYGDGGTIDEDTVRLIGAAYQAHTVRLPWRAGDLLLVDNVRTAHSREAYEGPRDVVVAMAAPTRLDTCPPVAGAATGAGLR